MLSFINICRLLNTDGVCFCKTDSKGSCAAKPECKNGKSCPTKAILQKCFCCCLHLFISYLFLYVDYVLYHDYLLVFIDFSFVPMQDLLHYRVIFLYQKVFHTFMCSIKCTNVQYHNTEIVITQHYC